MRASLLVLLMVAAGCPSAQTHVDTQRESMKSSGADLFAGLPPPVVAAADRHGEVLRLGPVPKPSASEKALPFPPPESEPRPQAPEAPPLEVVRHTPEGAAYLVEQVVVAFNQPMVPLASVGELAQAQSPLKLSPQPEGRFRWLDTRTLVFEPKDRMPFATRYEARVPAGVRASTGPVLGADHVWSFQTPAAAVVSVKPWQGDDQVRPDEEIHLLFNAAVEPSQVARALSLTAPGASAAVEVTRLTTGRPSEWKEERSIRVKPKRALALDTQWTLKLAAGLKSTEGPLTSTEPWSTSFRTYAPLKVEGLGCQWHWGPNDEPCPPGAPLAIRFNNGLEKQALAPLIEVKPKVDDLVLRGYDSSVHLTGSFVADTRYTISVKAGVVDQFGQKLTRAFTGHVTIGPAQPELVLSGESSTVVLEAGVSTRLPGLAVNTPQAVARIAPVPLEAVAEMTTWAQRGDRGPLVSVRSGVITTSLTPTMRANVPQGFGVELRPALGPSGRGVVAVEVEVPAGEKPERHVALVQVTDLGLTATWSHEALHVLVASLSTGQPVANAQVELRHGPTATTATTDARGLATLSTAGISRQAVMLLVRTADDAAFLDVADRAELGSPMYSLIHENRLKRLVGSVFTDRGAYRPGETAHVTAFVGLMTTGPAGDVVAANESLELELTVRDARWNEISKTTVKPGPFGMIGVDVPLPKDATLGNWHVSVATGNRGSLSGQFDVREYRVPEFRVSTKASDAPPHLTGRDATFEVEASYFFGGAMPQAPYTWSLTRSELDYRPPGNDGFRFGVAPPWWKRGWMRPGRMGPQYVDEGSGQLDGQGRGRVSTALTPGSNKYPAFAYEFEAVVTDANRQQIASRTSLVAHRTLERVGLQVERSLVDAGQELPVEVIATDLDGRRLDGRKVRVALVELRPVPDPDARKEEEDREDEELAEDFDEAPIETIVDNVQRIEVGRCEVTTGASPATCRLRVPKAGEFVVRATMSTDKGEDAAEVTVWATGKGSVPSPSQAATVFILPDKETYEAGDTARVLVRSPFPVSRGFLVVAREGFADVVPFETADGTAVISFPVKEEWMPGVALQVVLSRGRQAPAPQGTVEDEHRPRWAHGEATIKVSLASRRLAVSAVADPATTRPGAEVGVNVETRDATGSPVTAGVTVMVVDEAVLSLTGFETPTPIDRFYLQRTDGIGAGDLRSQLLTRLALPEGVGGVGGAGYGRGMAMKRSGMMAEMAAMAPEEEGGGAEMTVRKDFRSTAFFERTVTTDASGKASVRFKLPDNLTEFRVMAVATDGATRFGSGDSRLVVRQPLIVRPSLPRFLNLGDRFEASAVVNNETGRDAEIVLRMLAANATIDSPLQTVKVAAGQAKEVRWHATAGVPGAAKFQVAAIELGEERFSDVAEIVVPTLLPATAEAFATYGSTQQAIVQPVSPPADALPNFGGLQISMSSTALTNLQDAARYLLDYPFGCVEQTASRLVPMLALGELLEAFELEGVGTAEERKKRVVAGIELLQQAQLGDGGFPSWPGGSISYTHLTAWVTFVLLEAKAAGFDVRGATLERAISFLAKRLVKPEHEWERNDHATRALVTLVLARVDKADRQVMTELSGMPDLPLFAKAWLLEAWSIVGDEGRVAPLVKAIENAAVETAAAVHFSEHRTEALRLIMHSDDRTDAIVLRALLKARAGHPLIEKVQRGLTKAQVHGRWSSTQANAWALLASRDYFRVFESATPAFEARAWVGDTFVGGERFEGRSTKTARVEVPMATLQDIGASDLLLSMKGDGRLYYRLGLRYAPASLKLDALEAGFTVTRTYSGVDDPEDVTRDEDGTWRVKAGKRVRVSLQVIAPDRRYWVALVDPMPAGFEAVDEALATSGRVTSLNSNGYWRWSAWNHEELRDDQARAFADRMWAGVWDHDYITLATTPGTFVVPPTRAEEMYAPETFGRSSTDRVVVVP